jgi:hypothetical protein
LRSPPQLLCPRSSSRREGIRATRPGASAPSATAIIASLGEAMQQTSTRVLARIGKPTEPLLSSAYVLLATIVGPAHAETTTHLDAIVGSGALRVGIDVDMAMSLAHFDIAMGGVTITPRSPENRFVLRPRLFKRQDADHALRRRTEVRNDRCDRSYPSGVGRSAACLLNVSVLGPHGVEDTVGSERFERFDEIEAAMEAEPFSGVAMPSRCLSPRRSTILWRLRASTSRPCSASMSRRNCPTGAHGTRRARRSPIS